jgi:PTH2 family peptidyl-tRNA hydrolase
METKQVIVLRKDLNMRKGKMVAQGAHASLQAYLIAAGQPPYMDEALEGVKGWLHGLQTKICVGVSSEQDLCALASRAAAAGLPYALITDAGKTEFGGVPTKTALAIGPCSVEEVDKITGSLGLL